MVKGQMAIYTDGACEPNPGPGGWGLVVFMDGDIKNIDYAQYGYSDNTTNNIMELTAILMAFDVIPDTELAATIFSDSRYCVDGINSWMHKWQKKGWKKKGGAIKNLDLWKEIFDKVKEFPRVKLEWVRGHNGDMGNELADEFAELGLSSQKDMKINY